MKASAKRRLVLLLGMHRSGTSLAAQSFAAAGLPMGTRLMTAPMGDNAEGYWEDEDVVLIQSAVLKARFGQGEWGIEGLDDVFGEDRPKDALATARAELKNLLQNRFASANAFGVKDPRTARLLPLWLSLADRLGIEIVPLLLLRRPSDVATSLLTRNGIPQVLGELMWLRSVTDTLRAFGKGLLLLSYEDWFDRPKINRAIVNQAIFAAGARPKPQWRMPAKPAHRHEGEATVILPICQWAHDLLLAGGTNIVAGHQIVKRVDGLIEAFGSWSTLARTFLDRHDLSSGLRVNLPLPESRVLSESQASLTNPGVAGVVHPNRWFKRWPNAYTLHPNSRKKPAAGLVWRGMRASSPMRLKGTLLSGREAPALVAIVQIAAADGKKIANRGGRWPIKPCQVCNIDIPIPFGKDIDVQLLIRLAPSARSKSNATVTARGFSLHRAGKKAESASRTSTAK